MRVLLECASERDAAFAEWWAQTRAMECPACGLIDSCECVDGDGLAWMRADLEAVAVELLAWTPTLDGSVLYTPAWVRAVRERAAVTS